MDRGESRHDNSANDYEGALRRAARFSGSAIDATVFVVEHPDVVARTADGAGLSSLFVSPDGEIYVIRPHTHAVTAAAILRESGEPIRPVDAVDRLTVRSGILRAQLYGKRGIGVCVNLDRLPTQAQLDALAQLAATTDNSRFAAEFTLKGTVVFWEASFQKMLARIETETLGLQQ